MTAPIYETLRNKIGALSPTMTPPARGVFAFPGGDMTLPTRTVTGHYHDAAGQPLHGSVIFAPSVPLTAASDDITVPTAPVTAPLDAAGTFSVTLLPTDAAGVLPAGWAYQVTEQIYGASRDPWHAFIPSGTVPLDIADITPVVPADPMSQYVLASTVGQALGVASLGADGLVPTSQLPAGSGGTGPAPASTVTDEMTYGVVKVVGASPAYARADHTHGSPSLTSATPAASAVADTATVGVAATPARADHKHARESFGPVTAQTSASMASSNGAAVTVARSDHAHGTPAAGGGSGSTLVHKSTGFVTSGDVSATGAAFAQIGTDLSITATTGDVLLLQPEVLCLAGSDTQFEAATRVSSADVNWWSSGTGTSRWPGGLSGWYCEAGNMPMNGTGRYTVQAGDVVAGSVTVRFYARSTGAARTVKADTNYPTRWSLTNIGPDS